MSLEIVRCEHKEKCDVDLKDVPNIVDSISLDVIYKSVTDRYYSRRYCLDVKNIIGNDHLLLFHSNKICVITLAPSHPVFKKDEFDVNYLVGNVDRTKNTVKGKGKKGGQVLDVNSTLCKIVCKDGDEYSVSSCIKGKLIEVNEELVKNPSLLKTDYDSCGYIAVVLSVIGASTIRKDELLTEEEYKNAMKSRVK